MKNQQANDIYEVHSSLSQTLQIWSAIILFLTRGRPSETRGGAPSHNHPKKSMAPPCRQADSQPWQLLKGNKG